jgi:hypothetical protein
MKNWCYVNIPDWKNYQPNLQKFIINSVADTEELYNYISIDKLNQHCAEIVTLIESYFDAQLERVIVFKMTQESIARLGNKLIHIDSGPRNARLNWPVLNPNSIVTKYFRITDPEYQPVRHILNPPFSDYTEVCDSAYCEEIDSVCVDQPTIFTVNKTPHGMFAAGDQWPRLICSFNFVDDANLVKYLEE